MRTVKRVSLAAGAAFAGIVYLWFAAVRAVPGVERRKAERRAARLARPADSPQPR